MPDAVARRIEQELPFLQSLYRELHQKPELSFQEAETGARIADELAKAGATVTRRVGGHGVVGVLTNGPGPVILLRSDLDGLPVREQTGLPFSSAHRMTNDLGESLPTMHACGHDIHMGSLVGSARVLSALRSSWKGTVIFLGQPAEERGGGARPGSPRRPGGRAGHRPVDPRVGAASGRRSAGRRRSPAGGRPGVSQFHDPLASWTTVAGRLQFVAPPQ